MHIPMGHKLFILMTDVASLRYFMGRSLLIRIVFRVCMAVYTVRLILIEFRSLSLKQFIPSVNALPVNIPYGMFTGRAFTEGINCFRERLRNSIRISLTVYTAIQTLNTIRMRRLLPMK